MICPNQNSALSTILYEHVCPKRLAQVIKCPEVEEHTKKELSKYAKKYDRSKGGYRVNYDFKGLQYGRRHAEKSLSLQNFKSAIRETLVHDTHTDIDIKNCHPVLLAQYCEKNNIPCVALKDYVNHRDVRIQELIDVYGCNRKMAKKFMIHLLYLDEINMAQLNLGFELKSNDPDWVVNYANELQAIAKVIIGFEPAVYLDAKKLRKEEYKNKEATTISYVIQRIEDQIIQNVVIKLRQNKIQVDTLCFDGVLVKSTDVSDDLLEELSSYCYQATNYQVEFAKKPMKSSYTLKEEQYDFADREFLNLEEWDQIYAMSLEGQTPEETYALRKAYFEKHFCIVEKPTAQYVRQGNGIDRTPYIMTGPELSQLIKPIKSGFTEPSRARFFSCWDEDPHRRQYRKMDFMPYNPSNPIEDTSVFNLFEGFNPCCFSTPMKGDFIMKKIKPFLDLAHEICGGDDDCSEYFHRFIADIFQNPSTKPPVAICIKSKEGVGKNVLLDTIGHMLNKTHYITSSNPDDFFGNHAEGMKGKLLINLNEAEGKGTFDYEGRIKSFITEPTITINPKNIRPMEINNYARTIVTTNKPTPIAIDVKGKDRRWVVFQSTEKTLTYSRKFWSMLIAHFKSAEFAAALYQYYTQVIDNNNFDWAKQRPITSAYRSMCDKFQPVPVLFLEEFIRAEKWELYDVEGDSDVTISINTMDLFEAFNKFKKEHLFNREGSATNSRAFQSQLMELGLPIDKLKSDGIMRYRFIPDGVYEAMEQRAMINSWKFDEEDRKKMEVSVVDAPEDYFV
tara:strand:- start:5 stop:2371 length:2367 start_codon:yes stop_codon:yes gene_type:complete